MTSGYLGLLMLGLIVVAIMMGFPTAFTLMGLGMLFGYVAYFDPSQSFVANRIFDLMVQRTYGGMTNDTLLSIPLFVLMGYVIERAALVDKMFKAVQLSFRRLPASLAVATLVVCTFWGIASGIVGAVVVLMGVIAMRPMLNAGYDTRLAAGVITAGGTLGILIPPSVMLIVYAAVAGQSVVKLYAAAIVPGFFLAFLYFVYVIGWALIDPKVAPKLPESEQRMDVPEWLDRLTGVFGGNALAALIRSFFSPGRLKSTYAPGQAPGFMKLLGSLVVALGPLILSAIVFAAAWWYVVIHSAPDAPITAAASTSALVEPPGVEASSTGLAEPPSESGAASSSAATASTGLAEPPASGASSTGLAEPPASGASSTGLAEPPAAASSTGLAEPPASPGSAAASTGLTEPGAAPTPATVTASTGLQEPGAPASAASSSATGLSEPSAASSPAAAGPAADPRAHVPAAFYPWFWGLAAATLLGLALFYRSFTAENLEVQRLLFSSVMPLAILTSLVLLVILLGITTATESAGVGAAGAFLLAWHSGNFTFEKLKESVYLTAKTTAMVCWLFVGSGLFSAVFALHGGQELIERWLLAMNLSPLQFLMLTQALIFVLGWPLEWTEIIVIFVPIFLPLLAHFQIDPILFATLVAVNLQAAFLSPPVAMSAFYLKGVSPPHVTLNQIFAGMMPYMLIVILCMALMYIFPGMTLWLPEFLYGK
jgi:TRAP-type mannitol/chloroaromatic compound transport system permease large subunit